MAQENERNESAAQKESSGLASFLIKRRDKTLPPMPPAAKRKRGDISPGTDELIAAGYRVPFVDTARGVGVVLLVLYSIFSIIYNYGFFRGTGFASFVADVMTGESLPYWIFGLECLFVFFSGISANYTRSPLTRAVIYACGAVFVTAVSLLMFGTAGAIWFGYLHFLTAATLLYSLLHKKCDWIFDKVGLAILLIFFVGLVVLTEKFTFDRLVFTVAGAEITVPYFITGFVHKGFTATEFFGILPWIFMYFTGVVYGRYLREGVIMENLYKLRVIGLDTLGRNALFVYLLHTPVIYGLIWLLDKIF